MPNPAPTRTLVLAGGQAAALAVAPQSPSDAASNLLRPVSTWASPADPDRLVMLTGSSPEACSALRVIRHRIERRRAEGMHVFAVSAARPGEGSTSVAVQLALVLSEAERARVLLVDANFTRPGIASALGFGVPEGSSFSEQLAQRMRGGKEPFVVAALGPSLHVLAERPPEARRADESAPLDPTEALHSMQFPAALTQLSHLYDYVLIDTPAVLGSGDANVVEDVADGVVLVVRSGQTKGNDLRSTVAQLGTRKLVGAVLWDCEGHR